MSPYQKSALQGLCWLIASILFAILSALFLLAAFEVGTARGAMTDCIDATCRISAPDGGRGTGCVFEISQGSVYILTAAHVVEGSNAVTCEFWRGGHISSPLRAAVISRAAGVDVAILAVSEASFGGILPAKIPVATKDFALGAGETFTTVGCAKGNWATALEGHVLGYSSEMGMHFVPSPENGRSGSAIFDRDGTRIVGIVRARSGDDAVGYATTIQDCWNIFGHNAAENTKTYDPAREKRVATIWHEEPAQCPGGNCPLPGQSQPQWRLLPYRYNEQYRNAPQQAPSPTTPWPTLPTPTPAVPKVDLEPILEAQNETNQRLSTIADLLVQKINAPVPAEPEKPAAPPVDEEARKAAAAAQEAIGKLDAKLTPISEKLGKVDEVIKGFGKSPEELIQSALDRINKVKADLGPEATAQQVTKAYVDDLVKEKIKEGIKGIFEGGFSFDKFVSLGGGIPAIALAVFGCVVVWKLVNNKPLAVEKLLPDSLAAQAAADLREKVSSLIAPLKNDIDAKINNLTGLVTDTKTSAATEAAKVAAQVASQVSGTTPTPAK
jgi:hypothetical protein